MSNVSEPWVRSNSEIDVWFAWLLYMRRWPQWSVAASGIICWVSIVCISTLIMLKFSCTTLLNLYTINFNDSRYKYVFTSVVDNSVDRSWSVGFWDASWAGSIYIINIVYKTRFSKPFNWQNYKCLLSMKLNFADVEVSFYRDFYITVVRGDKPRQWMCGYCSKNISLVS